MFQSFLIALQFLTRIPLSFNLSPREGDLGRSLLFYPIVGLLIGVLLVITGTLTKDINLFLSATVIVTVWVIVTGGLHLDGLADTTDAWIGGMGSKERTLEIMKDPTAGPMGVLSLILLILLKTAAVYALLSSHSVYYLLIPPVLGRTLAILLLATTPYIREGGLGEILARELNTDRIWIASIAIGLLLILFTPATGIRLILSCAGLLLLWRYLLLKRLGGCTGDTIGALIEIAECSVLVIILL
jgi:adenosylcobinamide-GDP ribazoletransferase